MRFQQRTAVAMDVVHRPVEWTNSYVHVRSHGTDPLASIGRLGGAYRVHKRRERAFVVLCLLESCGVMPLACTRQLPASLRCRSWNYSLYRKGGY